MLQPYIILIILVITMGLFISGRWHYDKIALIALALSVAVGAVPYHHVFNGLANPAVITVACVMIISQTIHQSNLLAPLTQQLLRLNLSSSLQVGVLSLMTAFLSAFMNNVGALGLMMPIAIQAAIKSQRSPSLVLLPIALASALGGLLTLIGTPSNLIIANFRAEATGQPFEMFDFFRVGIFVAIAGVIFIALIGWRLIPDCRKRPASVEEDFAINDYITDYRLLPLEKRHTPLGRPSKKWLPVLTFALAVTLAATQLLPVAMAFSGAILMLLLTGHIRTSDLYKTIEWPIIILLAAMIPVGEALESSGGTELIANFIASSALYLSPILVLSLLFVITMTLSDFMNNAATTVVMAPIAIGIAQALHANVDPFLMAVAIAASCSFLTPVGHQNNTIVMGPGGYRFTDYIRIGLPLELLVFVIAIPAISWLWPI